MVFIGLTSDKNPGIVRRFERSLISLTILGEWQRPVFAASNIVGDVVERLLNGGKQPVSEFLDSLDAKMAAKMISLMEILEEKGTELRLPYSSALEDGIFELRCKVGSNISRALYFFYVGKTIVVTNGFVKKTQKTPPGEIKLAKARRQDWLSRNIEQERHKKGRG